MVKKFHTLLLLLWFVVIALVYFHTTDALDQDLGRHLKLGEIIWQTKEVPKTNLFSFTNTNEPVFNSHWGSQVIFYAIHKAFGVNGLIILNTIVNTAAFGMLFTLAVRRVGVVIPSLLFIPYVFLLLDRTWIRPEMFGNLFYAIILVALFSSRVRGYVKWTFPLMTLLWINLHITAVLGVFAMFIVLLQDLIKALYSSREGAKATESRSKRVWAFSSRQARTILYNGGILLFVGVALLVNPYGLQGVLSAFTVLNKYGYTIVENQSLLFLRDFGFPLVSHIGIGFVVLFVSFLLTITRIRRFTIGELILLVVTAILILRFVRNETLFAYTAFLTASFNIGPLAERSKSLSKTYVVSGIALFVSFLIIINTHSGRGLPIGFGNNESYKHGVGFFIANNLEGPIFNNFDIGGYLIYRLYPKKLVFVDNRPEAYPVSFFQDVYKPMQFDQKIFDAFTKHYNIQTIIWGRRDITDWSVAFLSWLPGHKGWKVAYLDEAIVIFTKVQ